MTFRDGVVYSSTLAGAVVNTTAQILSSVYETGSAKARYD